MATLETGSGDVAGVASASTSVETSLAHQKLESEQQLTEAVASVASVASKNEDNQENLRNDLADFEERAAMLEHDAGMPRAWADTFALIIQGPPVFEHEEARWRSVVDGALIFADCWAGKAHRLGWTVEELFGLHPLSPAARVDRRGLAFLLGNGARVVAIDAHCADILTAGGAKQRYYRQRGGELRDC